MTAEEQKAFDEAQAKIKELTEAVESAKAELEKQKEIVVNAEKKFNDMAGETGDNRKAATEAAKAVISASAAERKAREDLEKLSQEVAELKKISGPKGEGEQADKDKAKTADEIQAGLTKEEQEKLDKLIEVMSPEELTRLDTDTKERKRLLLMVKEKAKSDPDPAAWRKKPTQQEAQSKGEDWMKELFNRTKKSVGYQPDGPSGGTPNGGIKRLRGEEGRKPATWIE